MTAAYEDNFGFWEIDGPEERAFFEFIKGQSAYVNCEPLPTPRRAHPVQNPLCLLRLRCRMRRAPLDQRI
jgi:hypothetical protein